jgi:hypothetical protein
MTAKSLVVSFFAFMLGAAALAGEGHRTQIEVAIDDDQSGQKHFRFDSQEAEFNLHDMQIGESRSITSQSGQTAFILRTEDGFEFEVDGKKINMGDFGDVHGIAMGHGDHTADALVNFDENIHMARKIKVVHFDGDDADNGVTVISDNSLDETTQQQIRDVLSSSGHSGEVTFIDANSANGDHASMERVHIIKQEVDVTN